MPSLSLSSDSQENQFAIDKELHDSTLAIRDELNLIAERIAKMDEHKSEVSEAVYLRVKSDYLTNYDQVQKNFQAKTKEIEAVLATLYKGKNEQASELKKHQEVLEEAKFRNFLGEFSDKKFKEIDTRENDEIKRYENLLSLIETNIKQYEELIGSPLTPVNTELPKAPSGIKPESKSKIPLVDESVSVAARKIDEIPDSHSEEAYILEAEGDYFQNNFSEEVSSKKSIKSEMGKAPSAQELPKLKTKPKPVVEMEEAPTSKQAIKLKTEKPKTGLGFDDSISSILKSIPLEDSEDEKQEETHAEKAHAREEELPEIPEPSFEEDAEISVPLGKAKLVCIEGDLSSSEFELEDNTSIGRSPSNDIVLKEPKVSRQHAAINLIDDSYVIVDLKSSNGVFVNGRKVEEHVLEDGDEVLIGNSKFDFHGA